MTNEFDKNFNISYIDKNLATPTKKLAIKHCLCSYVVYFAIYIILVNNPFFKNYFIEDIQKYYQIAFALYLVISPIIYIIFLPKSLYNSHSIEICGYFAKLFKIIFRKNTILKNNCNVIFDEIRPSYRQKQAIMVIIIKVFFGTLMTKFLYNDIQYMITNSATIQQVFNDLFVVFDFENFKQAIIFNSDFIYQFVLTVLFTIDVACFFVGYLTECTFLKNKIKTVDTSIFGILACIICYVPFNNTTTTFLGWYQNDYAMINNDDLIILSWSLRIIALLFLCVYTLASLALFTKASNLTNRGTVSRFPYNIVRHPAYVSKNIFWFLTTIQLLIVDFDYIQNNLSDYLYNSFLIICSFLSWVLVYYIRAITEERHLMQDPEYQEYAKKVKWRFIPFVF